MKIFAAVLGLVLFSTTLVTIGSPAYSAGECSDITNVERRLVCIEAKADSINAQIENALENVKIEQASRPSICLFFKDHDQPALAISDCSHTAEQTFNIHK